MLLKASLHIHTGEEREEYLFYDAKKFIDIAAENNFSVLAFTCHDYFFYPRHIVNYAKKKNIVLIPGIEKNIEKKHVVILNADQNAEKLTTFSELEKYKKQKKNSLIMAAHPYFPSLTCLHKKLSKYLSLFDAIEFCHFYTKKINFNKKAVKLAKKHHLPLIATGDVHTISQLFPSYTLIKSKDKKISSIISALKNGNLIIKTRPLGIWEIITIYTKIFASLPFYILKKLNQILKGL